MLRILVLFHMIVYTVVTYVGFRGRRYNVVNAS